MRRFNLSLILLATLLAPFAPLPRAQQTATAPAAGANAVAAPRTAPTASAAARKAAENITAARLREDLYWVADDARQGRNTPSPGLDETARFIADRLARAKVRPAGDDGTYFQKIELRSTVVDLVKTRAELGGHAFKAAEDFVLASSVNAEVTGQLVFVGHGWVVKSKGMDAYAGLDVRDKIMVVTGGGSSGVAPPQGVTTEYISAQPASDWESPVSYAQKHGARAVVLVPQRHERIWQFLLRNMNRTAYTPARLAEESGRGADVKIPVIVPSAAMLAALFEGERSTGPQVLKAAADQTNAAGFDLTPAKRLTITTAVETSTAMTQNVVGVLEGGDAKLKDEYVAIGAHYDHVGVGREVNGDAIYNGADDDGSGTVAVLAIAEAFARGPRPKRSILFVWHCGEEKGLWGSEYFVKFPTVPIRQVVAQLNIDMIGRSRAVGDTKNPGLTGPDEIYVIGSKMMSTELGELSESVNRTYLNLKYNYKYDAPDDPEQFFYRSDHYNYALQGVPIAFFFDGVHEDYHRPSDTPDKIDYQKMEKVTRTVFVMATELANMRSRVVVDKPLAAERRRR